MLPILLENIKVIWKDVPLCSKMTTSGVLSPLPSFSRVRSVVLCVVRCSCCYFCVALLDSLMLSTPFEMSCLKKRYLLSLNLFFQLTSSGVSANSQPVSLSPCEHRNVYCFQDATTLLVSVPGTMWFDINSKDMTRRRSWHPYPHREG